MTEANPSPIRAFISYSWTSPSHKAWVLNLAERLMSDGVDVELDTWALQPGKDATLFMEQMVTDKTVTKVIMVCDRKYKEKADEREGGVGKEAQILTAEIYNKASEDKYAAIITEVDENGMGFLPTYYHSKQYIDFADRTREEDAYQELVRWIYNRPQFVKPKLGAVPAFIAEPDAVTTGTTSKMKQAEHAIKSQSMAAGGAIIDFGDAIVAEFEELRPVRTENEPWDETVFKAAASMRPALRNLNDLLGVEARYGGSHFSSFLDLFERLGALMYRPEGVTSYHPSDFDAYKMICYEGFLALVAILIRARRFDLLTIAIKHPYFIKGRDVYDGPASATFRVFNQNVEVAAGRKSRLKSNLIDPYAEEISSLYKIGFPSLAMLNEADLILFIRDQTIADGANSDLWWPRTLLYANGNQPTELFARSESRAFFGSWAPSVMSIVDPDDFKQSVTELHNNTRSSWGGPFAGPNLTRMANLSRLVTRA